MSAKRVILANGPRLLREVLHHVISKTNNLEIIQETPTDEELPSAIERFGPAWVILSAPSNRTHSWVDICAAAYPSIGFIFLSPDSRSIKMKWQTSPRASGQACEEDLTNLSLKDFIHILERDLQYT